MKVLTLVSLVLLQGCTAYGGFSVHAQNQDAPEFNGNNPLGILGLEYDYNRFRGFCEHISSIPDYEQGWGFNQCGVIMKFNP